jgi:ribosomal protein S18 acetylase RimI-like enzyme
MPEPLSPADLLAAFEEQIRNDEGPPSWHAERVGPVLRAVTPQDSAFGGGVFATQFAGLSDEAIDRVIREQVDFFTARGREWEWKTYAHDYPADLTDRLRSAGLEPEEAEALVVGELATVLVATDGGALPDDVEIREAREEDFAGISELRFAVWGSPGEAHTAELKLEKQEAPDSILIYVAAVADLVVCAAWVRFHQGTDFASLWGGSTREEWRGRGIYRALVRKRAQEALSRGYRLVQVDASDDSRPILERLGMTVVSSTTPYVGKPPA